LYRLKNRGLWRGGERVKVRKTHRWNGGDRNPIKGDNTPGVVGKNLRSRGRTRQQGQKTCGARAKKQQKYGRVLLKKRVMGTLQLG